MFFNYIDTIPDLKFMLIFVILFIVVQGAQWLYERRAREKDR